MDLLEAISTTRAIRRFRPDPVSDDDLAAVMFAATRAPSGSNRQPFRFLVLRDGPRAQQAKQLLGESFRAGWKAKATEDGYQAQGDTPRARMARAMQHFVDNFEDIPVVVLACLVRYRGPTPTEGASIYPAVQNLLLTARSRGLGGVITMWHGFVERPLREVLGIPDGVAIMATIPLGHPEGSHGPLRRRPMSETVFEDGWGEAPAWADIDANEELARRLS